MIWGQKPGFLKKPGFLDIAEFLKKIKFKFTNQKNEKHLGYTAILNKTKS